MTETQQLIEEVRAKLGNVTDYKIAQALDLHTEYVSRYVSGDAADTYTCAKIAEILGRDPLEIIAQVEAKAARTEKKRLYWSSFISFGKHKSLGLLLCGTWAFFGAGLHSGNAEAGTNANSHNGGLRKHQRRRHHRGYAGRRECDRLCA